MVDFPDDDDILSTASDVLAALTPEQREHITISADETSFTINRPTIDIIQRLREPIGRAMAVTVLDQWRLEDDTDA